jgi:DNA-binding MarR family transcriptional regulator
MNIYDGAMTDSVSQTQIDAWARLMRAQAKTLAAVEADLKKAGLPPLAWYDVLLELKREPSGALRPFEIEQRLLLAQHNVSRLLDRMEAKGLLVRKPHEADGRGQIIVLTEMGRDMQRKMWPVYRASLREHVAAKLNEAQAAKLAELLRLLM